jgi:hypothetical protein
MDEVLELGTSRPKPFAHPEVEKPEMCCTTNHKLPASSDLKKNVPCNRVHGTQKRASSCNPLQRFAGNPAQTRTRARQKVDGVVD